MDLNAENSREMLEKCAGKNKIALIFHLKISDFEGYNDWLYGSKGKFGSRRMFRVKADPVPREGMEIDEIVIDEFPSSKSAIEFMSVFGAGLKLICSNVAVLAIVPEPSATFRIVKAISWLVQLFKGVKDCGIPSANWKAPNIAVWPDEYQMDVARSQNLDESLFVYNLNKNRAVAEYQTPEAGGRQISGQEAYDRYAKIAGFELLRRGAFPVYGGKPVCLLEAQNNCMLADRWDKFIFVRYPQRRNLLAIIESDEFVKGQTHRDAGLERVAIFMGREA
ncbi:MAG: hypothetical protein PHY09_17390 [Desulfuromonadaceae bacterium]|nr:hypothetical protein [Desulfuromonadaceae bacterium]MDD5105773.1 hypothetical protein [Desulfuromonadaceae bacterium]